VASGKQAPYYPKKREIKRKLFEMEYQELESKGKVDKSLEKKRRKNFEKTAKL